MSHRRKCVFWIWGSLLGSAQGILATSTAGLEPMSMDLYLTDAALVPEVRSSLLPGLPPNGRWLIPALTAGQTSFPTRSDLFRPGPGARNRDWIAEVLRLSPQREVYALVNTLLWAPPGTPPEEDLFLQHPELQAVNGALSCDAGRVGKYASPLHPRVRSSLTELVREIGERYPNLSGLVLECRLPRQELLGFSDAARVAFIRDHHLDPRDLTLVPGNEADRHALYTFARWRREVLTEWMGELSQSFREVHPGGRVVARAYANFYRWSPGMQMRVSEDWLRWVVEGYVDELLLEADWEAEENRESLSLALQLLERAGREVEVTPLLNPPASGPQAGYSDPLQALQKQATVKRVAVTVDSPRAGSLRRFLQDKHQVIPRPVDRSTAVALSEDKRLRRKVSLNAHNEPLPRVVARLSETLQLPLQAAGKWSGRRLTLALQDHPAVALLKVVASQVGGTWEADGKKGYVLREAPDPACLRGDRLLQAGRYDEAITAYQEALARGSHPAQAWRGLGQAWLAKNDPLEALAAFEEAQLADPDEARVEAEIGHCYRYLGDMDTAIEYYEMFLEQYPEDLWGLLGWGMALLSRGDREAAQAPLEKVVQLYPQEISGHVQLGRLYHQQGELEKSRAALERGAALQPQNVEAQEELGRVAMAQGDYPRALQVWEAVLKSDPGRDTVYAELGHCHRFLGQQDQAIAAYEKFLERHPQDLWGLIGIGAAWIGKGKPTPALSYLERAAKVSPADSWVHYFRARALLLLGNREQARTALRKALASDPHHAEAEKLLQELPEG